jgi:outer membrane lipoprotein carrier protein
VRRAATRIPVAALCALAMLAPAAPAAFSEPRAAGSRDETLEKARSLYGRLTDLAATFEQVSLWQGVEEPVVSRGSLSLKLPDRVRLDYREPDGDVLVSDGRVLWTYVKSLRQAVRTELDSTGYHVGRLLLAFLEESAGVERIGEETVDGKAAVHYRVLWTGNPFQLADLRVWISRAEGHVVRFEFEDSQGNRTKYVFSKIRTDRGLGERLFDFAPPPGTDVVSYAPGASAAG